MKEVNTQLKFDGIQDAQLDEASPLTLDELGLVGGGECVLNGV